MTDIDNTYFGRKNVIAKSIAESYAKHIANLHKSESVDALNYINTLCANEKGCVEQVCGCESKPVAEKEDCLKNCDKNTNEYKNCLLQSSCGKCVNQFIPAEEMFGDNYTKTKETIKSIRRGVCQGQCFCSIKDVDMSNIVILKSDATINEANIDATKISNDVLQKLEEKR